MAPDTPASTVLPEQSSKSTLTQNASAPSQQNGNAKPPRPRYTRPDYNKIHAKPLPLEVHPLPAFIPHNPLSVVRIAIALISHKFRSPNSLKPTHLAYFSPETQSVHVTNAQSIRALWEQGFFGAGSLSRSEPRWLDLEKRKLGLQATATSEEKTRLHRNERRLWKLDRARKEQEAREAQLRLEKGLDAADVLKETSPAGTLATGHDHDLPTGSTDPNSESAGIVPHQKEATEQSQQVEKSADVVPSVDVKDQEHLQLMFEEAFFLVYVVGALKIFNGDSVLTSHDLFRVLCAYSTFPYPEDAGQLGEAKVPASFSIAPDNEFLLRYVVYHHFRSLGWVVRDGVKFASDYILYDRGPAFTHAEFGVMIMPTYSHPYWSETLERKQDCEKKGGRDWWWFHRANRVQTQVYKTLVLAYVEVPPPWDTQAGSSSQLNIGAVLKSYKVREIVIRRWTPNRNRG